MAMPNLVERYWTAEDVRALPEDGKRYECIDGVLLVTPSPATPHQDAVLALTQRLAPYLRTQSVGKLFIAPADVEIEPGTTVQPDVFVARSATGARIRAWREIAMLVLAIEVLSPSTANVDRGIKRKFFQRAGVDEYWIVDLAKRQVERWTPSSESADVFAGTLVWSPRGALDSLELDLVAFFAEVLDD
jgi:Uma2 family endonuclease